MNKYIRLLYILSFTLFLSACSSHKTELIVEKDPRSDSKYFCLYDATKYNFILDLPEETNDAPLIFMLHGYGTSAEGFRNTVHLEEAANKLGYAVVYVTGSVGWNYGVSSDGNDDIGFLTELADYLQKEFKFDKKRTYAVGYSNGGFMAHRLAVEAPETFSACVSVAGKLCGNIWKNKKQKTKVSFLQFTGEKDDVIPKHSDNSAAHAIDPAIEDVISYYSKLDGLTESETSNIGNCILEKHWSNKSNKQVWHVFIKDGRHAWPDMAFNKIDTNLLIMEFLETKK
ncbi:MAG: prolyl oligopeptidase family serine peptidase [Treponema sp.]|nr:prolyl oligopeptidase family serine peptidase [Treponema sp.]